MTEQAANTAPGGAVALDPCAVVERLALDGSSWVEVSRGWLAGADERYESLRGGVAWRASRGRCQADWEHSVPYRPGRAVGARILLQWRHTSRRGRPFAGASYRAPVSYGTGGGR